LDLIQIASDVSHPRNDSFVRLKSSLKACPERSEGGTFGFSVVEDLVQGLQPFIKDQQKKPPAMQEAFRIQYLR